MVTDVGLWGLFTSAFISSTIAPGGSELILAYLVSLKHYSNVDLLAIATVGNTLGAMTTWWLGVFAEKRFPLADLLPQKHQNSLAMIKKYGICLLFFSWFPVIGDGLCFAAGWLKLPFMMGSLIILIGKLSRYAVVIGLFN